MDKPQTDNTRLYSIVDHLMAPGKGLLAADESTKSANKRFEALGIATTEESRRRWRQLLLATPNADDFLSGVILYDETIRQKDDQGDNFTSLLKSEHIITGIKVDMGLADLTNFPTETITEGLDGLDARLKEYYKLGARFAKWRSAFAISSSPNLPTEAAVVANAHVFGRYASLCQANGIVPIIEPEVLYSGMHSLDQAKLATGKVIGITLDIVRSYRVDMRGIILKTSMVLAGQDSTRQSSPEEVAKATLEVLSSCVPAEVGGIVFLSGGQGAQQATANLNPIGSAGKQPWPITFSYSRAVQEQAMKAWHGSKANVKKAQDIFYHRLACNSAARSGQYNEKMEIFQPK